MFCVPHNLCTLHWPVCQVVGITCVCRLGAPQVGCDIATTARERERERDLLASLGKRHGLNEGHKGAQGHNPVL